VAQPPIDYQEDGEIECQPRVGGDVDGENVAPLDRELVGERLR
jgi:hypothetical protein